MKLSRAGAVVLLCLSAGILPAQEPVEETRDSGIVERAEGRLMQIDVTVRGPAEAIEALAPENFSVTVGREDIEELILDRVCIDRTIDGLELEQRPEVAETRPKLRTMLYFDQVHLTSLGRQRALELAGELIPQLVGNGNSEAMLVSAGRRMKVAAEWTSDPEVLIAALGDIAEDPLQVMTWADEEERRVDQLMTAIDRTNELADEARYRAAKDTNRNQRNQLQRFSAQGGEDTLGTFSLNNTETQLIQDLGNEGVDAAKIHMRVVARELSKEEASRTSGGLSMFAAALMHLDEFAPPKAVIYFADTVRSNPGDHLIGMVHSAEGTGFGSGERPDGPVRLSMGNYVHEFQDVIDLSTEKGVRLYTVQGRGLQPQQAARGRAGTPRNSVDPRAALARFEDAENALSGLAAETGGESFLWAADASDIAGRVLDDLSCLFVLSFRALDLKTDRSTAVFIDVDQPGVELQYRPRLIALSDEARDEARLASAFWDGNKDRDLTRIVAIPTGYDKGKYTVLIQFAIPGARRAASDWDMGVTVVHGTSKARKANGRVSINQPGMPLVFEAEMKLKPGDYSVTAVAKHRDHNQVISTRLDGALPDPEKTDGPFVVSTVFLQRVPGAFVRGEQAKTVGSLAHGSEHWLRPDRPTGILALVCGKKDAGEVTLVRRLEGAGAVSFEPIVMGFEEGPCNLVVDTIDAGTFTSGRFAYYVGVTGDEGIRQAALSEFLVVTPEEVQAARLKTTQ